LQKQRFDYKSGATSVLNLSSHEDDYLHHNKDTYSIKGELL